MATKNDLRLPRSTLDLDYIQRAMDNATVATKPQPTGDIGVNLAWAGGLRFNPRTCPRRRFEEDQRLARDQPYPGSEYLAAFTND